MTKHCIICNDPATFQIKDTADYYCQSCAEENFADLSMLVKVEEEAQKLKKYVKEKTTDEETSVDESVDDQAAGEETAGDEDDV